MTSRPAAGIALTSVCVVAMLTACAPQPRTSPTPSPRFTSESQAFAAAEATYRAYVDALNKVDLSDPATFEPVYRLETGKALDSDKRVLTRLYSEGAKRTGDSIVRYVGGQSADENFSSVKLNVCLDVSAVRVVDTSGASMVDPHRSDVQPTSVTLSQSTASDAGFLVASIRGRDGEPAC